MKLIVVAIVVCAFVSSSSAAISYGTSRPFGCRFEDDCRVVRCGSGIKRDSRGCALRGCPCEEGFTPPNLSCVCKRAPCPCSICPRLTCPVDCAARNGWAQDAGCNTCECKPRCGPVCDIFCEFGNVEDEFGCPTCRCKPPACDGPRCRRFCPNGFKVDKNGCEICECNECPRLLCAARECPNGVKEDKNGCPTCECKCGPVCKIFCEFGNVEDEFGCPTCRCKSRPCPLVRCSRPCEFGFQKDKFGCQGCTCKPHIPPVKPGSCPQLRFNSSRMRGRSKNGCKIDSQCPRNEKCCRVRRSFMVCVEPRHPQVYVADQPGLAAA